VLASGEVRSRTDEALVTPSLQKVGLDRIFDKPHRGLLNGWAEPNCGTDPPNFVCAEAMALMASRVSIASNVPFSEPSKPLALHPGKRVSIAIHVLTDFRRQSRIMTRPRRWHLNTTVRIPAIAVSILEGSVVWFDPICLHDESTVRADSLPPLIKWRRTTITFRARIVRFCHARPGLLI
jgi:hypothetical protein